MTELPADDVSFAGKRVLMVQQRGWSLKMGHFLAKRLQAEGALLAAYTVKRNADDFTRRQTDVKYEYIESYEELVETLDSKPEPEISFSEIESQLKIDTVWPILSTERTMVWDYGQRWYYGFRQGKDDNFIRKYGKYLYLQIRKLFDEFQPDIVISPNIIFPPHIFLEKLCAKTGANIICVSESKIREVSVFNYKFDFSDGPLIRRFHALENGEADSPNYTRADSYIEDFRTDFKSSKALDYIMGKRRRLGLATAAYRFLFALRSALFKPNWGSTNYVEGLGVTVDYRPPRILFRDSFMPVLNAWRVSRLHFNELPKEGKYVYYPLQLQPEAPLDNMAYLYNNQFEVARLIARCIPGDYSLVVKEHPGMLGRRGPKGYRKLMETPNVTVLNVDEPTSRVLDGASLMIGPGSTTMVEAAFLGIPAIQLGDHSFTELLPNVQKSTGFDGLAALVRRQLELDCTTEGYRNRLRNYVASAFDTGFTFNYFGAWEQGEDFDQETLWGIYRANIVAALEDHAEPQLELAVDSKA